MCIYIYRERDVYVAFLREMPPRRVPLPMDNIQNNQTQAVVLAFKDVCLNRKSPYKLLFVSASTGLWPTDKATRHGRRHLLANKQTVDCETLGGRVATP